MEARAIAKHVRLSPRKARRVIDLVRGENVDSALNILHFTPGAAALPIEKTLRSAVSNLLNQESASTKLETNHLFVKVARVDEGVTLRRYRPASHGRAMRIRKRTCHITIVVSEA